MTIVYESVTTLGSSGATFRVGRDVRHHTEQEVGRNG